MIIGGPGANVRGAALLMALFVAAIATTIVSGLFWRQFVLLRTIDNQQLVTQSRLLLRSALDWADSILQEDAQTNAYVALTQPWAQPLAETKLDQLSETSALASQATMSGGMEDAQSRFNLSSLVTMANGAPKVNQDQFNVLASLASELSLPEPTAGLIATYMLESFTLPPSGGASPLLSQKLPLPLVFPEDLKRVPGLDPAAATVLAPYVVVLGLSTQNLVNFNTAPAELIAAEIPGLTLSIARAMAAYRDRIPFRQPADVTTWLQGRVNFTFNANAVAVISNYFFVRGEIKLQRADTRMEALVQRSAPGGTIKVLWEREV